jgi:hypothetical protein
MNCYIGRFRVPAWLYAITPQRIHEFADKLGGVEPCKCTCHDKKGT